MLNRLELIGRLADDPKDITGSNDNTIAAINVAAERGYTDDDGDQVVDFLDVVFFGKQAEIILDHLSKGRMVQVDAQVRKRKVDGEYSLSLVGNNFRFLDNKGDNGSSSSRKAGTETKSSGKDLDVPF